MVEAEDGDKTVNKEGERQERRGGERKRRIKGGGNQGGRT